jgi:hypothetical protein
MGKGRGSKALRATIKAIESRKADTSDNGRSALRRAPETNHCALVAAAAAYRGRPAGQRSVPSGCKEQSAPANPLVYDGRARCGGP